MAISEALKKFRSGDMGEKGKADSKEGPSPVRSVKLSDEEKASLEQVADGAEVKCDVTAKKAGDHLHIMSIAYTGNGDSTMPDQEMNEMAGKIASGLGAPMSQQQTAPSPS